jgi:Putative porin
MKKFLVILVFIFCYSISYCQNPLGQIKDRIGSFGNSSNSNSRDTTKKKSNNKLDTLGFERRDDLADSIAISFRYMDSLRRNPLDSSVNDFDKYYSVPSNYQYLGNNGAAAFSLIYKPFLRAGWDEGFHAFDIYKFKLTDTKFYKTTGPFTMLGYQIAGGKEQMVQATHTQNPRQNINFGFDYRLINAPGFFVSQNNNHNNFRFFSTYQSLKKRYNAAFVYISNSIKASENGGIVDDAILQDPNKKQRFSVPVRLGNAGSSNFNPFSTKVNTGNTSKERILFYRHSYDLGKRDSIAINDSTTEYLFYPKLRIQHTFILSANEYQFKDIFIDTNYYKNNYAITYLKARDTFLLAEKWNKMSNDFTLITFPDTKNAAQFLSAGVTIETIKGSIKNNTYNFYNAFAHGEYRNRTRNKLWDLLLKGELYLNGFNAGNYNAQANISRNLGAKLGYVSLYFNNVNRTPSFVFDNRSGFNIGNATSFKNENIITFGASSTNKFITAGFNNIVITNYAYFKNLYQKDQYNKPINLIQFYASKKIKLKKYWYYYADATVQIVDNAAPINVPLLFTRSRISFEKTAYKNLKLSAGLELRYYTNYKPNNYSPLLSQFTAQDNFVVNNKPDVSAFFNFRIRGFTTYIRMENLNTITFKNGFGFRDNNFAAPHHPNQGQTIRFGIKWWFVK